MLYFFCLSEVSDSMQWTRAMEIFGTMSLSAALTCGFLKHFVFKRQETLLKAGCTCGFAAGSFLCLIMIIIIIIVQITYLELRFSILKYRW